MSQPDALQYLRRVWRIIVLQMIVDISAALVIVALVALFAAGLVFVSGHSFGMSYLQVRESAEILGGVYILAIWARTLRRHWIVAGQVTPENPAHVNQTEVANVESSPASN